jgi:hypothetical protein
MTAPFPAERLAALARLSAEINATAAPPPIAGGVEVVDGRVSLPVPDHVALGFLREGKRISAELHAGLTLQWAPVEGGAVVEFRGGSPDGDEERDACACFLTVRGLRALAADCTAIAHALVAKGASE